MENTLVKAEQVKKEVNLFEDFDGSEQQIISTLPNETMIDKVKLADIIANTEESLKDKIKETLKVVDFIIQPQNFTDEETGEVTRKLTLILVMQDGTSVATNSKTAISGLARNILVPLGLTGKKIQELVPYIPVYIKPVKTPKGQAIQLSINTKEFIELTKDKK